MSLSLKESQAIAAIAGHLYDFLPGSPHPYANKAISFPGVAAKLGLGQYWTGGSKRPALTQLLSLTLEQQRGRFCGLVTEIVRQGITYRQTKNPVAREDIEQLNALVREVSFKIPELNDPAFLDRLPRRAGAGATTAAGGTTPITPAVLDTLQKNLLDVSKLPPIDRGFAFEGFLNGLFDAYKLAPRGSFRLVGEQIDGSFQFHGETYLMEARWRDGQADENALLGFSGKVTGKATWSRGLFISNSGFTPDGLEAFARGKPTRSSAWTGSTSTTSCRASSICAKYWRGSRGAPPRPTKPTYLYATSSLA